MRFNKILRVLSLLVLLSTFVPLNHTALAAAQLPPVDMFQLPWELGKAWVAIDGFDNGSKRPAGSPHNYLNGGAIDFAPHPNMVKGENTASYWVTAVADGKIVEISKCHMKIAHANGWVSEYQHLANLQVKLGDTVARNQKLAIIANASTQPVCAGSEPPDIPHLHFALRPNMVGATFAGWEFRYSWFWNSTTFRKGNQTVGLNKPLLNSFDSAPNATPTPVISPTATLPGQTTPTPGNLPTNTPTNTPTTPSGPYVSTLVDQLNILIGDTALVTVRLNNIPSTGYTSAEFTCTYAPQVVEISNVVVDSLFGADPATAMTTPQSGTFILAIAGSKGNKAATSGNVFTFNAKGLQVGQTPLECTARVSTGDNVLTPLPSIGTGLSVLVNFPTPTLTQIPSATPTAAPLACDQAEFIADITVPPGTVMLPGEIFKKTWRLRNIGSCMWTMAYQLVFFSGEQMSASSAINFPLNVEAGETVDLSLDMTAPSVPGSYQGNWMFKNPNGALFGVGPNANEPFSVNIIVSGPSVTPGAPTQVSTPTSPTDNWLTFTNLFYSFQFKYPPQGVIASGNTNNYARIDLPFTSGTNLSEKYLEVFSGENAGLCQSPLATSGAQTSETVVINGITFLKQTGEDAGAGNVYQWVAYSTQRDSVCVSLDFILHSHNPGVFPTPPPVFDYAAESAVFAQIVETYSWLGLAPTSTPGFPTPFESPTSIFTATQISSTATPISSSTPAPDEFGSITGHVFANKPVIVTFFDVNNVSMGSVAASPDGTFGFSLLPGTYTVIATADGFLSAQASVTFTAGVTITKPDITLVAGDIDNNHVIDQFDAMTIGMSYNTSVPDAADLNNDGVVNVLDLELLARNYRKTGPVAWE